ncbi:MAG TPA: protein kinase, partial [Vicinamibacterales bacterium]|nr:protein kinase [Vicinamibacterales bacterium]
LNHPNIAQIYGIEESASIRAIVMELVPGEDLSARIAKGPIPLAEALPLARQVADALEAAHENGIVHRDLKPANVKVTTDGRIKILDFGLAKLGTAGATGSGGSDSGSPTLTAATEVGTILGTAAYMAPEQAEGKNVDKRADVWAFGVLLYEMLTGRSLFTGASTTEVLAAVIRDTPDWSALPADVSPAVRRLLARCLAKDPKRRLRDIGDARFELEEMDAAGEHPDAQKTRFAVPVWVLAIAVLVAGTLGAVLMVGRPSETPPGAGTRRAAIELGSLSDSRTFSFPMALSGDGSLLVYTVGRASGSPLYARRLDSLEARPIEGTAGAVGPFLSRDGRLIGFEREGGIFSVPLAGGPVVHARGSAHLPGGSPAWTEDGRIVLTSSSGALVSFNADGSSPRTLTTPSPGERHLSPFPLPGGRTILFTAVGADPREARLAAVSLADGQVRSLVDGGASTGQFADGYLVYARPDQRLMAVLFDATRVEKTGVPQPLPDRVTWTRFGIAHFSVAPGVLVYFPPAVTSLVEVDRGGGRQTLWTDRQWHHPRYSPDGTRIVVDVTGDDGERDVWVFDRALKTLSRTTRIGDAHDPSWLPDGRSVSFLSFKSGGVPLLVARADGTSPPEPLRLGSGFFPEDLVNPGGWIRDGSAYVGGVQDRGSPSDLWLLPGDGS